MPGTDREYIEVVCRVIAGELGPGDALTQLHWTDGTACSTSEARWLMRLIEYEQSRVAKPKRQAAQRRAMGLLRTLLNPEQLRTLRASRSFKLTGSLGGTYRLWPRMGLTEQLERHGTRHYRKLTFCLHDPGGPNERMPNADLAIAHMLWLVEDEQKFLVTANHTVVDHRQWDGAWRRRLNQARRERQAERTA